MILKSYEIQKNKSNLLKYNFFLMYGENLGLKKDIKEIIKNTIQKESSDIDMISLYQDEILENKSNFYDLIYSGSLFGSTKIIGDSSLIDDCAGDLDGDGNEDFCYPFNNMENFSHNRLQLQYFF